MGTVVAQHATATAAHVNWEIEGWISAIATDVQRVWGRGHSSPQSSGPSSSFFLTQNTDTLDDASAQTVVITGENGAAFANDIVYEHSRLDFFPT